MRCIGRPARERRPVLLRRSDLRVVRWPVCQATDARRGVRLVCGPVKLRGHDMHNRQAGSSAVSEARRNRRALANGDTSDDALFDSKYRVVPRPRAAGDSAIRLVDCQLLIRQRDATALDYMSPYGGRD
jgi:hypothetical protein